jgi:two-component system sensor histidine kinase and response regulator WspE
VSDDLSGFSLIELFRSEAEGQIVALSEGLLALEAGADPATTVEPLMRAAHSLKGAARIVGLGPAERLAHVMEDIFVAAQKGSLRLRPDQVDVLLAGVDLLGKLSQQDPTPGEEGGPPEVDATIEKLRAIESGTDAAPPPEKPATKARRQRKARPRARAASTRPPSEPETPGIQAETPPSPAEASTPPAPPPEATPAARSSPAPEARTERVVRVAADNMNRLMGLAGASLVEARQLRPIVDSLLALKALQGTLWEQLQRVEDAPGRPADADGSPLSRARQAAAQCVEMLVERIDRMEAHARRNEDLSERLHHEVISSRLRPLIDGVRGFPRLVRDVSRQLGKQVRFEVVGEQTGVDRDILEKLEAPLNHLIRNALDHGIEAPAERTSAGKDATATIRLEARHVAGMLQITLQDDGRGIDVERVRAKVIERDLSTPAMAADLSESEVLEFLFLPGFSTKAEVTELSGRGVGLDVVQSMVQAVGGSVRVSSSPGRGTCFSLLLPITMSVIRALLVTIGGEPYAFPLSRLDRIEVVPRDGVELIEGRPFFKMDDVAVGLVAATEVLERPQTEAHESSLPVVVVSDRGHRFGVVVDRFLGERDLDVRPLDARLGKVPNINSASALEDGQPVLIIDVEDLVRSIDNLLGGRRLKSLPRGASAASARPAARRILVVDDSLTVRELERQLLEGRGYAVDVAVDGMDGWNAVRAGRYDLVVSDVDMPRMDGIELVQHIKQDARFRSLPVVIVSYKDRAEDRIRGLDAGADSYLTKSSFHDETFLDTVFDLLGEARG